MARQLCSVRSLAVKSVLCPALAGITIVVKTCSTEIAGEVSEILVSRVVVLKNMPNYKHRLNPYLFTNAFQSVLLRVPYET